MNKFACHWKPILSNNKLPTIEKQKDLTSYILMRLMSQSCAYTCDFLTHMIFFYSQLHAIFGVFNLHFLVNIYMSGAVASKPWAKM